MQQCSSFEGFTLAMRYDRTYKSFGIWEEVKYGNEVFGMRMRRRISTDIWIGIRGIDARIAYINLPKQLREASQRRIKFWR